MTDRYGKRRVSKMLAEWNRLREAVREGNLEGIQNAFDACEEWIDFAFGQNKGGNDAKLAKAVEALHNAAFQLDWCQAAREISKEIDATLSQIKGEIP